MIHHVKPRGLIRGSAGPILTLAVLLSLHVLGLIHSVALEAEVALAGVLLSTFLGGIRSGVLALVLVAGYLLGTNLFDLNGHLGKNLGESSVLMVVAVVGIGLVEAVRRRSLGIIPEREARQRAEKRGEVSAARLDHIGAVRWEADSTLRFTFVSSGGEELLGYPTRTWYSESGFWENHLHPADRFETVRLRSEALKSGRSMELVYRMVGFDGRGVWVRDTSEVTLARAGSTASITGWMVDITQE
ncbi:MAG: PAS domain-containing protein, partial [Actinomycetota bacterium]